MNTLVKVIQVKAIIAIVSFSSAAFSSTNLQNAANKVDNHTDNHEQCEHPIISQFPIVVF
ncbi:hypothetical protein [uncultured Shewanella sp.]|uniref:hypothetical protein n=1 Tax=uncultured Shewanella sp. TaxID=173975 RepID=UPI0026384F69|nr:hypothetical protein [uncultured Shewanella sp.]